MHEAIFVFQLLSLYCGVWHREVDVGFFFRGGGDFVDVTKLYHASVEVICCFVISVLRVICVYL